MQLKQGGDSGRKCRVSSSAGLVEPGDEQLAPSLGSRGPGHVWSLSRRCWPQLGWRLVSRSEGRGDLAVGSPGTQASLCLCRGRAGVTPTPQNLTLKLKSTSPCPRGTCTRRRRSSRTSLCTTWTWPTRGPRYHPPGPAGQPPPALLAQGPSVRWGLLDALSVLPLLSADSPFLPVMFGS